MRRPCTGRGYCREAVCEYRRLTGYLCEEAEARELGPDALNPEVMDDLARVGSGSVSKEKAMTRAARRFAGYLVDAGVIEPVVPPPPDPGSPEGLCEELEHWLRHHKGMYNKCRLRVNRNLLGRLMAFRCTSTGAADDPRVTHRRGRVRLSGPHPRESQLESRLPAQHPAVPVLERPDSP